MHLDKRLSIVGADTIRRATWIREWQHLVDVFEVEVTEVWILTQLKHLKLFFDLWVLNVIVSVNL